MIDPEGIWVKHYDHRVEPQISIPSITCLELLERSFVDFSDKIACRFLGTSLSFNDIDRYSRCFAAFLSEKRCTPGDVVAINLPNTPQFLIANIGAMRAGCFPTGLSPLLSSKEMIFQLKDCGAKVLVTLKSTHEEKFLRIQGLAPQVRHIVICNVEDFLGDKRTNGAKTGATEGRTISGFMDLVGDFKPKESLYKPDSNDVCFIQYTGGTTGPPKGALLTHRNVLADILQCNQWLQIERGSEIYLPAFPFYHLAGLGLGMTAMCTGHTQIIIPNPRDTRHICHEISHHRPTIMAFVPSLYHMLLQEPQFKTLDFSSCRICKSGAAPFPPELMVEVESVVGAGKIVEVYGLTETFILTMNPYQGEKKVGTVGIPVQSTRVRIVDLEGGKEEMPCGEEGEIIARGPQIMPGYYNKPEETSSTFRKFRGEMWFFTGDIGRMDEDGYLTIVDRVKDMIIVGGYKVFSKEVEEALYDHPAVAFCAVVGVPNPAQPGSEQVKAVIQPSAESMKLAHQPLKEELAAHCRENLAAFKVPKIMDFVENIPLTAVGKVDKKALKSPND